MAWSDAYFRLTIAYTLSEAIHVFLENYICITGKYLQMNTPLCYVTSI